MYLVGPDHPNKAAATAIIARLAASRERIVTDAEVFQEILHRYKAIGRPEAVQPAFDFLTNVCSEIFDINLSVVESAKVLLETYPALNARDAIHLAVARSQRVNAIFSFDAGFDAVPNVVRIFH